MIWVWVLQRCRAYGAGRSGGAAGTETMAQRSTGGKGRARGGRDGQLFLATDETRMEHGLLNPLTSGSSFV